MLFKFMRLLYVIIFVMLSTFAYAQNASDDVYSPDEFEARLNQVKEFKDMGLYNSAIEVLDDMISHTNNDILKSNLYVQIIMALSILGENDKIIERFQQITNDGTLSNIEDNQVLSGIYLGYAAALENKKLYQEAIAAREKEIFYCTKGDKNEQAAIAYMGLASDYRNLNQKWQAINCYDKSISIMMQILNVTNDDIRKEHVKDIKLELAFNKKSECFFALNNMTEANYNLALAIACGGESSSAAKNILDMQGLNYKEILKNHP